ncbi:alpha/beta hydrolase [Streptomyces bambusae]|uniref:alpha/beta fold hydrolase n=1 Tax=Streptomyces bambusae TaxID=1550616 RepID=UPI001CFD9F40|nr:alpha/beta hydrolase [Streptomyces bambusae]MCB5163958.1 alpha/beta hydrolase [Streptomyces bambusae]
MTADATARRQRDTATLAELELTVWAALGRTAPGGDLIETMVTENAEQRLANERHCVLPPPRDAEPHLAEITAPTLVLHGTHDRPEISAIAHRLTGAIPGACGHTIPHADHYLPLRTPAAVTTLLLSHLP